MKQIYIYGASGHGLVVADIAKSCEYDKIIFIDDGLDSHPSIEEITNKEIPITFGIGNNAIRKRLFEKVERLGFQIVTLVHPSAVISPSATIGAGTVVMPHAVINAQSRIGRGVILNSGSIIEHENSIGDFVHISPNCALAGNVTVQTSTHVGIGSTAIQGVTIGKECVIGAGSLIIRDIPDNKLCYGHPCNIIKEIP
jgi:UDP-N-acetylbacillosamine N-acetyltransferase